jgi:hypothetical protein
MPIHDWTRVDAGIFHHFHHAWIEAITRALNAGLLPQAYYALAEQYAAGFGPDVLTLQELENGEDDDGATPTRSAPFQPASGDGGLLLAPPKAHFAGEADIEFYRRKQPSIAVRHVSDDRVVAMVEIVSPGNKAGQTLFRGFVNKAAILLEKGIHLLIIDLLPPTPRDPHGIHAAIWEEISGQEYLPPHGKPLMLASYERSLSVRAYVEHVAVGDPLMEMPLFLEPGAHVPTPLEATYQSAWSAVPRRWQRVLEAPPQ